MDLNEIKEILQLLEEKEITEFELEQDGVKLRVVKAAAPNHGGPLDPGAPAAAAPAPVASAPAPTLGEGEPGETIVKSPIVGTFFRAPEPNASPFVNVGDNIKVGQVLCIIEAMKLMNEIEAEVTGQIVAIHRENGQPVQYGDPLFTIRPAA